VRQDLEHDWLVIGSGFGGSVAALRLAEKGHRVGLLECGRRFADHELPRSTWDLRRYFWAPKLGFKGIFRLTIFRDVAVVSGSGVGGGSLGYANTLYRARPSASTPTRSGPGWRTGRERSRRTTTPPSGCSAS
jgi:cholesterol oxidase